MLGIDNNKRSLSSVYTSCTAGPRRGKVLKTSLFTASSSSDDVVEQQNVIAADDDSSPLKPNCHDVDETTTPTAEDYANLFFASDDEGGGEDDDDNNSTGNSIQTLTMQYHHLEPEPHYLPTSTTTTSSSPARRALLPPPLLRRHHNHHQQQYNKRRRVSFTTSTPTIHTLSTVPPASTMTPLEKSATWLQSSDIESLKSSAQSTIQAVRNHVVVSSSSNNNNNNAREKYKHRHQFRALMVSFENETNSSIRGLEHKVYRRKATRRMLTQDVIECQRHIHGLARFGHVLSTDEQRTLLANASLGKSVWCVKKAMLDAHDDYREVYNNMSSSSCCLLPAVGTPPIRRVSAGVVVPDDGAGVHY